MNEEPFYSNAPITEALFDIQVDLPETVSIKDLDKLCLDIVSQYPTKKSRKRFEGTFKIEEKSGIKPEKNNTGIDGFLNWSSDQKEVVQFRLDGFAFSRLKPYEKWDKHFSKVIQNWTLYEQKLSPLLIKRVTLRFINTIEIPSEISYLSDYFVNSPQIPIEKARLSNFFNRIEFSLDDPDTRAIVTQTLVQYKKTTIIPVIFDSEIFKDVNIAPDAKRLSDIFNHLRKFKNEIFEKSLKQKAKDLFR